MLVQWQKDFEVGHPAADAEHREVVDLLNELDVCLSADVPRQSIDRALGALAHLLSHHLQDQDDAAPVVDRVRDLHRNWRQDNAAPDRSDLRALAHWWLNHLCSHERRD